MIVLSTSKLDIIISFIMIFSDDDIVVNPEYLTNTKANQHSMYH